MKKILLILLALIFVTLCCIYLFIPNVVQHSSGHSSPYRYDAVLRRLKQPANWLCWADSQSLLAKDGLIHLSDIRFRADSFSQSALYFSPVAPAQGYQLRLAISPANGDSTRLQWEYRSATSYNPIQRINRYREAQSVMDALDQLSAHTDRYFRSIEGVYGFAINEAVVSDSLLISTSGNSNTYPDIPFIYSLIDKLYSYLRQQQAQASGAPMLNILKQPEGGYLVRVALPVNRELPQQHDISFKRMLAGGNILITEVKGGTVQLEKASVQIENYIKDFKRMSPAIPFLSLVTDRRQQPDSTQWITRIYYPVM
ncbi:MAG: GyrI-like domain-containing protein [Chitinophagaceae bacterium]|nr:GyrI-like domain-containing protein [Chitinophagaceae bacterium]